MCAEPSRHLEPIPLQLTTHASGDGTMRLAVGGEIDIATVGPLADAMTGIITGITTGITIGITTDQRPKRLVVDFAEVTFLDSSGVSALVAAWRLASVSQIEFVVVNCRPNVLRVLEITGMAKALTAGTTTSSPDQA